MDYNNVFQLMKHERIPYISNLLYTQKPFPSRVNPTYIKELRDLTTKTNYKDKQLLFYKALLYYDVILYQAYNHSNINLNFDLLALNAFYLGIKFTQNQINMPRISQLKHMNKKYSLINAESFLTNEIKCLQLMNYSLVYSSSYDFMLMTLQDKQNVFEKATYYLDKFISSNLSTCYSPYSIACVIINYTMSVLGYRDPLLMKRYYVDKKSALYQAITNLLKQNRDTSNESTLGTDGSKSNDGMIDKTQDIVAAKFKRMRQLSKNIDLSRTNEYYEMNKTLVNKQKDELKEKKKEDKMINDKDSIKKLVFAKEQTRRSCNNIFSAISLAKNVIKKAGTISIKSNCNNENYHFQPSTAMPGFSDKKDNNKLNIDIRSLSKIDLNQVENAYSTIRIKKEIN